MSELAAIYTNHTDEINTVPKAIAAASGIDKKIIATQFAQKQGRYALTLLEPLVNTVFIPQHVLDIDSFNKAAICLFKENVTLQAIDRNSYAFTTIFANIEEFAAELNTILNAIEQDKATFAEFIACMPVNTTPDMTNFIGSRSPFVLDNMPLTARLLENISDLTGDTAFNQMVSNARVIMLFNALYLYDIIEHA